MFVGMNIEKFNLQDIIIIREKLEKMDDDKFIILQGTEFQQPSTIFLISVLVGWDRFWLDDIGLAILKLVTLNGCMIWWVFDIISAKKRAKAYNLKKFLDFIYFNNV